MPITPYLGPIHAITGLLLRLVVVAAGAGTALAASLAGTRVAGLEGTARGVATLGSDFSLWLNCQIQSLFTFIGDIRSPSSTHTCFSSSMLWKPPWWLC